MKVSLSIYFSNPDNTHIEQLLVNIILMRNQNSTEEFQPIKYVPFGKHQLKLIFFCNVDVIENVILHPLLNHHLKVLSV